LSKRLNSETVGGKREKDDLECRTTKMANDGWFRKSALAAQMGVGGRPANLALAAANMAGGRRHSDHGRAR
jgi:hypothetical protein